MTATVLSEAAIAGLPSASGIEIVDRTAYVVGDDSPNLYLLDAAALAITRQVPLFETASFATGRVPRAEKPDVECMAAVVWPTGEPGLLLLGSGSQANRARGWFVPTAAPHRPVALNLSALYAKLSALLPAGVVLNLEAAATTETDLLLFQRTVGRADAALLFALPLATVLQQLARPLASQAWPQPRQLVFELPLISGCPAGFSGATFTDDLLFVSASVENTADAVLDGEVLGSFLGVVSLGGNTATFAQLGWADGRPYRGKVEGLAVRRRVGEGMFEMLLVTDDDAGGSTAAVARLVLD